MRCSRPHCRRHALIGRDPARYDGYAYGNISQRATRGFVVSGTQTGGQPMLTAADLAWVLDFDSTDNRLQATGPARPSSEAMSHGEVYAALPGIAAVIHVHSPLLWQAAAALGLPVTDPAAGYGTPAMARAIRELVASRPAGGVLAMGGHEDGIIAYAPDMARADALLTRFAAGPLPERAVTGSSMSSSATQTTAPAARMMPSASSRWVSLVPTDACRAVTPQPMSAGVLGMARTMAPWPPSQWRMSSLRMPAARSSSASASSCRSVAR